MRLLNPVLALFYLFLTLVSCSDPPRSDTQTKEPKKVDVIEENPVEIVDEGYDPTEGVWVDPVPLIPQYTPGTVADSIAWQQIDAGLDLAEIPAPIQCSIGDSKLTVLRIDPQFFQFELMAAGNRDSFSRTAREWAEEENLVAVFNAGMFQQDGLTNAGLMKHYDYVNNSRFNPKYKSIVAFNPKDEDLAPFRIVDVECDPWKETLDQYHSYTQCLRMVSCKQKNVWSQQTRYWSMVSVGVDQEGNALFCFTRSPYSVHDFNDMLLQLPLQLARLMYLEGGPETSFFLHHSGIAVEKMGSYETGFTEHDDNDQFWAVPNVIGVRVRE